MDLFTYLMAKNGHNTSIHEDLFSYLLGKSQGGGGEIKTTTGITINIPDAKKLVNFMMTKESTQEKTTGKNLLKPITSRTTQKNGIVFTYNEETQLYTFDGTCTSDDTSFPIMSNTINFENGITKIFAYFIDGSAESSCEVQFFQSNYSAGESLSVISLNQQNPVVSKTSGHTGNYLSSTSRIKFRNGSVVNNFKIKIMVTNDDDTTYEPYTNGASPNPDYPQEVKTVKGYRNLLNVDENLVFTRSKSINVNIPAGTYRLTKKGISTTSDGSTHVTIRFFNNNIVSNIYNATDLKITLTKPETVVYLFSKVDYPTSAGISATINQLMLIEGDQELPYVPYGNNYIAVNVSDGNTTNSYPIPLNNNEIVGIGNYKDELLVDKSGNVSIEKNTAKIDSYNGETITTPYMSTTGGLDTGATVYYGIDIPELIDLQTTVDLKLFKGVNNVSNSEDGYMTIEYISE